MKPDKYKQLFERLERKGTLTDIQINHVKDYLCGKLCGDVRVRYSVKDHFEITYIYNNHLGCVIYHHGYITQDERLFHLDHGDMINLLESMPKEIPENYTIVESVKTEWCIIPVNRLLVTDLNRYCTFIDNDGVETEVHFFHYNRDKYQHGFSFMNSYVKGFLPLIDIDKNQCVKISRSSKHEPV